VTPEELRELCLSFEAVQEDFPFRPEISVFKVLGKMFALSWLDSRPLTVNLKCDPEDAIRFYSFPGMEPHRDDVAGLLDSSDRTGFSEGRTGALRERGGSPDSARCPRVTHAGLVKGRLRGLKQKRGMATAALSGIKSLIWDGVIAESVFRADYLRVIRRAEEETTTPDEQRIVFALGHQAIPHLVRVAHHPGIEPIRIDPPNDAALAI